MTIGKPSLLVSRPSDEKILAVSGESLSSRLTQAFAYQPVPPDVDHLHALGMPHVCLEPLFVFLSGPAMFAAVNDKSQ